MGLYQTMKRPFANVNRVVPWMGALGLLTMAFLLGGCGPIGDEGDATSEVTQAALEITQGSPAASPGAPPIVQSSSTPTPAESARAEMGTPESGPVNVADDATPASAVSQPGRTPVPGRLRPPQPSDDAQAGGEGTAPGTDEGSVPGDGTTGAVPTPDQGTPSDDLVSEADEETDTATVDSCEPDDVPEFTGDVDAFVVVENLNFRTGPGVGCDPVSDALLESGTELTVTSDPVVRDGEGTEWIRVEVEGEEGWVATEYIEPANARQARSADVHYRRTQEGVS